MRIRVEVDKIGIKFINYVSLYFQNRGKINQTFNLILSSSLKVS